MTVHLIKLCVGASSVEDQHDWVQRRSKANIAAGHGNVHDHVTRMYPRREDELLDGGSIYWVIKGVVLVRQKILKLERRTGSDGIDRCAIILEPKLVETEPQPRRAFQGWRYLPVDDAPKDIGRTSPGQAPPGLSAELAELGLL